jgi:ribosomal protein S18 acetylase RimI-like enzyme
MLVIVTLCWTILMPSKCHSRKSPLAGYLWRNGTERLSDLQLWNLRGDGESELDALFVDPNMRRRGIARSLVGHCAEVARTRKSAALCVVGNSHAQGFYTACGFSVIGDGGDSFRHRATNADDSLTLRER